MNLDTSLDEMAERGRRLLALGGPNGSNGYFMDSAAGAGVPSEDHALFLRLLQEPNVDHVLEDYSVSSVFHLEEQLRYHKQRHGGGGLQFAQHALHRQQRRISPSVEISRGGGSASPPAATARSGRPWPIRSPLQEDDEGWTTSNEGLPPGASSRTEVENSRDALELLRQVPAARVVVRQSPAGSFLHQTGAPPRGLDAFVKRPSSGSDTRGGSRALELTGGGEKEKEEVRFGALSRVSAYDTTTTAGGAETMKKGVMTRSHSSSSSSLGGGDLQDGAALPSSTIHAEHPGAELEAVTTTSSGLVPAASVKPAPQKGNHNSHPATAAESTGNIESTAVSETQDPSLTTEMGTQTDVRPQTPIPTPQAQSSSTTRDAASETVSPLPAAAPIGLGPSRILSSAQSTPKVSAVSSSGTDVEAAPRSQNDNKPGAGKSPFSTDAATKGGPLASGNNNNSPFAAAVLSSARTAAPAAKYWSEVKGHAAQEDFIYFAASHPSGTFPQGYHQPADDSSSDFVFLAEDMPPAASASALRSASAGTLPSSGSRTGGARSGPAPRGGVKAAAGGSRPMSDAPLSASKATMLSAVAQPALHSTVRSASASHLASSQQTHLSPPPTPNVIPPAEFKKLLVSEWLPPPPLAPRVVLHNSSAAGANGVSGRRSISAAAGGAVVLVPRAAAPTVEFPQPPLPQPQPQPQPSAASEAPPRPQKVGGACCRCA
jgi:hypothetical protein